MFRWMGDSPSILWLLYLQHMVSKVIVNICLMGGERAGTRRMVHGKTLGWYLEVVPVAPPDCKGGSEIQSKCSWRIESMFVSSYPGSVSQSNQQRRLGQINWCGIRRSVEHDVQEKISRRHDWLTGSNATERWSKMRAENWPLDYYYYYYYYY